MKRRTQSNALIASTRITKQRKAPNQEILSTSKKVDLGRTRKNPIVSNNSKMVLSSSIRSDLGNFEPQQEYLKTTQANTNSLLFSAPYKYCIPIRRKIAPEGMTSLKSKKKESSSKRKRRNGLSLSDTEEKKEEDIQTKVTAQTKAPKSTCNIFPLSADENRPQQLHSEKKTGIIYESGELHFDMQNRLHKERPLRVTKVKEHLDKNIKDKRGLLFLDTDDDDMMSQSKQEAKDGQLNIKAVRGSDFLNDDDYLRVHLNGYMKRLDRISTCLCHTQLLREAQQYQSIYFTNDSVREAKQAASSLCDLVAKVVRRELRNGFAVIRPPGHHAEPGTAGGYCVINNVAVASAFARAKLNTRKVLIVDWDIHHGNGTQSIFLQDPNVLYFSVHRHHNGNFYPYLRTGGPSTIGTQKGKGYNVNVGWNKTNMGNEEYMAVWETLLLPMAKEFAPDLILVSAGFDCAKGDAVGDCLVSPDCFGWMTKQLLSLAGGKLVCTLEGGYVKSILGKCVENVVQVLMDEEWEGLNKMNALEKELFGNLNVDKGLTERNRRDKILDKIHPSAAKSLRATMNAHEPYWKFLRETN